MKSAAAAIVSLVTTPTAKAGKQLQKQVHFCYNKHYYYKVVALFMAARQAVALFCFPVR